MWAVIETFSPAGFLIVRMGNPMTCAGLYASKEAAIVAAERLRLEEKAQEVDRDRP